MIQKVFFLVLCKFVTVSFVQSQVEDRNAVHYTNVWGVKLSKNDEGILQQLRIHEGFEIIEQKHHIPNFHILIHRRHPRKGKYENKNLTNDLLKYKGILWAEQIFMRRVYKTSVQCPGKSNSGPSNYKKLLNDRRFLDQWYLQDCRIMQSHTQYDLNVVPVWFHYRLFGYNIKVMVADTGVQTNHPDLKYNYDPEFGYDFLDYTSSPEPKGSFLMQDSHGTKMAGIIGMQANNKICGVGIAPLVTLGAARVTHKLASNNQISRAIAFRAMDLDVSNNSWVFSKDSKSLRTLDSLNEDAFKVGIIEGRRSRGLIYTFPAGNGKQDGGTCAHDPIAGLIYTIIVAGVSHDGSVVGYSQRCSNILVTAYSGDSFSFSGHIVSTSTNSMCNSWVNGTSAATAMVSGIVALILEANINLTWREVHHVLAWTSQVAALAHNETWSRNKAGFYISLDFGFGLVDAFQAVTFAMSMEPIAPMNSCVLVPIIIENAVFNRKLALRMRISTNGCKNLPSEVDYMEHVQLMASVEHPRRGAIEILLISPSGTKTTLMESRRLDRSKYGLHQWVMDTVHLWGESPQGEWSIIFYDTTSPSDNQGRVYEVALIIHGTKYKPPHYTRARTYRKIIYQHGNMWS